MDSSKPIWPPLLLNASCTPVLTHHAADSRRLASPSTAVLQCSPEPCFSPAEPSNRPDSVLHALAALHALARAQSTHSHSSPLRASHAAGGALGFHTYRFDTCHCMATEWGRRGSADCCFGSLACGGPGPERGLLEAKGPHKLWEIQCFNSVASPRNAPGLGARSSADRARRDGSIEARLAVGRAVAVESPDGGLWQARPGAAS